MKRFAFGLLALVTLMFSSAASIYAEDVSEQKTLPALSGVISGLKPVIAKVNGKEIKKEELSKILTEIYPSLLANPQTASMDIKAVLTQIVDRMIEEKLLFMEIEKKKISVTDDELEKQLNGIYAQVEGRENFLKLLSEKKIDEKDFLKKMRNDIALNKLIDEEVIKKITLTEEEAKKFYDDNPEKFVVGEQVKASHILVRYNAKDGEEKKQQAMKKIKEIKTEADKGGDFGKLAEAKSEGPSASHGGDLGYIRRGQMVPSFEAAVFSMKKDEVSGIVETPFGFHIVKVFDIKPATTLKFDDIKQNLMQQLKNLKARSEVEQYYKGLKKKYKTESFI